MFIIIPGPPYFDAVALISSRSSISQKTGVTSAASSLTCYSVQLLFVIPPCRLDCRKVSSRWFSSSLKQMAPRLLQWNSTLRSLRVDKIAGKSAGYGGGHGCWKFQEHLDGTVTNLATKPFQHVHSGNFPVESFIFLRKRVLRNSPVIVSLIPLSTGI